MDLPRIAFYYFRQVFTSLHQRAISGDRRALARLISMIENESEGYQSFLQDLDMKNVPVIGITGPPGAGKSTLLNALLKEITSSQQDAKMAVLAVDPTSPFTHGALLGDRLRMNEHYDNANIYIRSLATRGALGGLSLRALEVSYVLKSTGFDYIFIETVGVGQSEVDIVSLADITVVVFVPESGDEVQALKAGIMEIADIFVVNKADRDGASAMVKNIQLAMHERKARNAIPVIKTNAVTGDGISVLLDALKKQLADVSPAKKTFLLAEHAYRLIQHNRMRDIDKSQLFKQIKDENAKGGFNIYSFVKQFS